MKFTFVILHYLTFEDTSECVDSIINNVSYDNYSIVIVDNGSDNESGHLLHSKYNSNPKIHIIDSSINLGFAKGNNLGYNYAKNNLNTDFVIMINNDTIIEQKEILLKIFSIYNKEKFDVLGPDIISLIDQKHQNPYKTNIQSFNKKNIKHMIFTRYRDMLFTYLYIYNVYTFVYTRFFQKYYRGYLKEYAKRKPVSYDTDQWDVKLHGSCLIFSPNYIRKYKGLYNNTFMYLEEDILFYIAKREKLRLMYSPKIRIFHKEDSSTNALLSSGNKKRLFILKNEIKSAKEILKMIEDNNVYLNNIIDGK